MSDFTLSAARAATPSARSAISSETSSGPSSQEAEQPITSSLLIDEPPLQVLPSLAVHIGLNEALILQQIHYWIKLKRTNPARYADSYKQGTWWVYNSVRQWQEQFPFWSEDTIQRALASLKSQAILRVERLSPDSRDRTNWYSIQYERLQALTETPEAPESLASLFVSHWDGREPGYVYLLEGGGFYKIGKATDLNRRVQQIFPKLPFECRLLHAIPSDDCLALEQWLHLRFAAQRVNGEWFQLEPDQVLWFLTQQRLKTPDLANDIIMPAVSADTSADKTDPQRQVYRQEAANLKAALDEVRKGKYPREAREMLTQEPERALSNFSLPPRRLPHEQSQLQ